MNITDIDKSRDWTKIRLLKETNQELITNLSYFAVDVLHAIPGRGPYDSG